MTSATSSIQQNVAQPFPAMMSSPQAGPVGMQPFPIMQPLFYPPMMLPGLIPQVAHIPSTSAQTSLSSIAPSSSPPLPESADIDEHS